MNNTQKMLDLLNSSFPDLTAVSPLEARALADARIREPGNLDDVSAVEDHVLEGGVSVRLYLPHDANPNTPVSVYAHGGGFLHGSVASHDGFCRRWSRGTSQKVVSVNYRLSPEHRAPAAVDDFLTAFEWASTFSPGGGVVVAGDSAGANLAAVAAVEMGTIENSPLRGQVLIYPFLDPTMQSNSYRENAEGYFVTAQLLAYYWSVYLGEDTTAETVDPRINPAVAPSHAGLPPTIVITAGLDPLRDEGISYAGQLSDAGVTVRHRLYPDQFHGFLTIPNYPPGESAARILWQDFADLFNS